MVKNSNSNNKDELFDIGRPAKLLNREQHQNKIILIFYIASQTTRIRSGGE